jgi:hypothetical protein
MQCGVYHESAQSSRTLGIRIVPDWQRRILRTRKQNLKCSEAVRFIQRARAL